MTMTENRVRTESEADHVDVVLSPALPRGRHRAPRKRHGRSLVAYGMTLVAGAVATELFGLLLSA